jgi:hypothetical protein
MQELFLESSGKRTLVVMPHVAVADLRDLLSFIYTGEVKVSPHLHQETISISGTKFTSKLCYELCVFCRGGRSANKFR